MTDIRKPMDILLVEDNEGDVFLTKRAFEKAKIANTVYVAHDGEIAMAMLHRVGDHSSLPKPDLVLLDINMPKKDGKQVLHEMKNDNNLRRIPVLMLTSSEAENDILEAYNLHTNSYIMKPTNIEEFDSVVKAVEDFWLRIVTLPPQ